MREGKRKVKKVISTLFSARMLAEHRVLFEQMMKGVKSVKLTFLLHLLHVNSASERRKMLSIEVSTKDWLYQYYTMASFSGMININFKPSTKC
jgi:hypothetical protein